MTNTIRTFWGLLPALCACAILLLSVNAVAADPPIRVAIVGLVHGHVKGFLHALPRNESATLVAIVEPQEALAKEYAAQYHLDSKLFYTDIERMLDGAAPRRRPGLHNHRRPSKSD